MNKEKFFKPFQDSLSNRHNIPNLNKPETEKFGLYNKKRTPASIYNVLTAHLMKKGKRSIAEKIIRKCVGFIKAKEEKESMAYAMRSIKKIRPLIGPSETVGAKRIIPITPKKSQKLAIQ